LTPAEFIDDPNWADFLPEKPDAPRARALPTHEDCSPLDEETAAMHLRTGGTLGSMPGYEERPGQIDMLGAIVRAFNGREHLMIEAGTGVGKSLAYLIPSILWAHANDTPVIVSTATRNLQSQLMASDIPRALKVLGDEAAGFKVALLKGRGNYLCLRAVGDFFAAGYWTMPKEDQAAMPEFIEWLKSTPDGDLDHYDGISRSTLTCPGEECSARRCPYYSRCFVYRARKNAAEANLVVTNHALLLAEAANPGSGLLPAYGRVVLDEAHNLEDIATDALSYQFSMPALLHIVNRLMRRGKGWRVQVVKEVEPLVMRVVAMAKDLATQAERTLLPKEQTEKRRYTGRDLGDAECRAACAAFENAMADLVNRLHEMRDEATDTDIAFQLDGFAANFLSFANETHFVWSGEKDTHVYWIERVRGGKRGPFVRLVAAPLSVADELRAMLWDVKDSAILSSATLRVGPDFSYQVKRLGFYDPATTSDAGGRYRCLTAKSPFDYFRQSLVLAPDCLPDPSVDAAHYAEALAAMLADLFRVTNGRALVLFTSYEMMNAVAAASRAGFEKAGLSLFVQGEGLSRESMTLVLKGPKPRVVLFGAQSFWEGVDVAGEALSCVVLARLPFAQRADPIVEARSERVDREMGEGKSFRNYYLPEAVIRFRQGFGRLIRSKRDRGVVIITDPRIVTKNYGAVFRQSIPASVHTVSDLAELFARVGDFFA